MLRQIYTEDSLLAPALPALAGAAVLYWLFVWLTQPVLDAPLLGGTKRGTAEDSADSNAMDILDANYRKYREDFFKIQQPHGETVILPVKYLEELKALPKSTLSMEKASSARLMGNLTLIAADAFGDQHGVLAKSVSDHLTRNLNNLMQEIHEECKYAFETHIGPCEDWTEVNIFDQLVPIIALISGRIFIGTEMNRDPEYLRCIIEYTLEVFKAVEVLRCMHPWTRWISAKLGWVKGVNQVHESHRSMQRMIGPLVTQRLEQLAANEEIPNDMVTWNMENSDPKIRTSIEAQAHVQLIVSMAAIHTTSMTSSHIIYELAKHPEAMKPLREEFDEVMAKEKVPYLSKSSTPKLKMLDSFCKESFRLSGMGAMTFNRKVLKPITLHDGKVLPKGVFIAAPANQRLMDEDIYPDPTKFDPWRFYKLRQEKGHESKHQFVTSSLDDLGFGYGTHACPGRFFANNELKVIITYVLDHYDVKMPQAKGPKVKHEQASSKRVMLRKRADRNI